MKKTLAFTPKWLKTLIVCCTAFVLLQFTVTAQGIGINSDGSNPDNSAMLDITSHPTGSGLLIPRLQLGNVGTTFNGGPAPHLFVTNLNSNFNAGSRFNSGVGFYRNAGSKVSPDWRRLLEASDSTMFWGTRGNAIKAGDFLGTTNWEDLNFKTGPTAGFAQKLKIPGSNLDPIVVSNVDFFQLPTGSHSTPALTFGSSTSAGLYGTANTLGFKTSSGTLYISGGRARFSTGTQQVADANMKLHIDGNIYTTEKYVYNQYHNSTFISNQAKTGKVERYWSGNFPVSPVSLSASAEFFTEGNSTDGVRFRLVKLGNDFNLQASLYNDLQSRDYVSNGVIHTLPLGLSGPWTNISPNFNNTQPVHTFMVSRNVPTGANNLFPTYRITVFFNGNNENVRVIVEAWYHL